LNQEKNVLAIFRAAVDAPKGKHGVDQGLYTGLDKKHREAKRKSKVRGIRHAYLGRMIEKGIHSFYFA
jgi:hypothetical protein